MTRVLTGLAAWLAGTALAVCLAWLGASMVVRDAGMGPGVQVINVGPATPAAQPPTPPAPPASPSSAVSGQPTASASGRAPAISRPSPSTSPPAKPSATAPAPATAPATASPTPAGTVRSYTLDGGRVALLVSASSAALVTAMPDSGFSVMTWSGTDWLRVDFSSGGQVSSLIASWYEHAPTVTVENQPARTARTVTEITVSRHAAPRPAPLPLASWPTSRALPLN